MRTFIFAAAVAAALSACDKGEKPGAPPSGKDAVILSWQKNGLNVSAFTPDKTGAIGKDCSSGTVANVDVVLCSFKSPDEAKAAEAKGWQWVGATTGTAMVQGPMVLAVADRRQQDPSGRSINAISKSFAGKQ